MYELLTQYGEKMTHQEIDEYLSVLVSDDEFDNIIPEEVSLDFLLKNLLGFEATS